MRCIKNAYEPPLHNLKDLDLIGLGCNIGSGVSSGPWLLGYAPLKDTAKNHLTGIVSCS